MCSLVHLSVSVMLLSHLSSFCVTGDAVMLLPSFEVRTVPHVSPFPSAHYVPLRRSQYQQNIPHVASDRESSSGNGLNFVSNSALFNYTKEAMDIVKGMSRGTEEDRFHYARVADHADNPAYTLHHRTSEYPYQSQPPNYSSPTSASYQSPEKSTILSPVHEPSSKLSFGSDFASLIEPVTTKMAGKTSGLMDFVFTLLSSSSHENLQMKGFKDLVINGIIKPLLIAKGGIKTLISKLTIPLIALLLINLEFLVTVWWLWEDCPQPKRQPEPYSYPHQSYNYNMSYR